MVKSQNDELAYSRRTTEVNCNVSDALNILQDITLNTAVPTDTKYGIG